MIEAFLGCHVSCCHLTPHSMHYRAFKNSWNSNVLDWQGLGHVTQAPFWMSDLI